MTRQIFCLILLLFPLSAGCGKTEQRSHISESASAKTESNGITEVVEPLEQSVIRSKTMVLSNGKTLRYSVYLPKGYVSSNPRPFILSLHYGGRVQPFYGGGMVELLVAPAFKELQPIIVAPDSLDGGWDSEQNRLGVSELLDKVKSDYPIDEQRTLVTGFSMGGQGTWVVAAKHQDFFRAAIPIAGRGLEGEEAVEWRIPFYVIHSNADSVVPIGPTRRFVDELKKSGTDVTFVEVDRLEHYKTYAFVKPLKDSVEWLKATWSK